MDSTCQVVVWKWSCTSSESNLIVLHQSLYVIYDTLMSLNQKIALKKGTKKKKINFPFLFRFFSSFLQVMSHYFHSWNTCIVCVGW